MSQNPLCINVFTCEANNGMCPNMATYEIKRYSDDTEAPETYSSFLCDTHTDDAVYATPEAQTIPLVRWHTQMSAFYEDLMEMAGR